jgi:hypothetical protein
VPAGRSHQHVYHFRFHFGFHGLGAPIRGECAVSERGWHALVVAAACVVAVFSAREYAGGWNDGSRLATVESLVDHGTWAIDNSIFVNVPRDKQRKPYDPATSQLNEGGTLDFLLIGGKRYSDKSPVPALLMAGEYTVLKNLTGNTARNDPDHFCWWLTLLSSGLAYVVAVSSVYRLGKPLQLTVGWRLLLTASFAFTTVAPTYAQHVNNHILLLAVAAALMVEVAWIGVGQTPPWRAAAIGFLAGFGYTIDLGAGPVILASTAGWLIWRMRRRPSYVVIAGCAALPWLMLHHGLNWSIGGTFAPANSVPAYLDWPGSPFTAKTMTGSWQHDSFTRFVCYALDLLIGKRGFLGHNLGVLLAVVAAPALWRSCRPGSRPEFVYAFACSVGAWLLYSATSTNSSGLCCSIRWFVPLLAPGYLWLGLLLRNRPDFRPDFILLSAWGLVYSLQLVLLGPWREINPLVHWLMLAGAGLSWIALRWLRRSKPVPLIVPVSQAA